MVQAPTEVEPPVTTKLPSRVCASPPGKSESSWPKVRSQSFSPVASKRMIQQSYDEKARGVVLFPLIPESVQPKTTNPPSKVCRSFKASSYLSPPYDCSHSL